VDPEPAEFEECSCGGRVAGKKALLASLVYLEDNENLRPEVVAESH
jgi:hypothetical protein